ncbi:glcG protein [Izhakiella australiensis]|uniref:GlcG protein n=1 Tax=Izhakiella australiensis TaxID=1926881 RepID=A0A1S8YQS1_9GAMM|nr:heme-binding protein [Izhakiella australiensis]OON41126.1 glcG protein [Izhakiella australiensis]
MLKQTLFCALTALSLSPALPVLAASLPTQPVLTTAAAKTVLEAAQAKAQALNAPAVLAVVDAAGQPVWLERMENADVPAGVTLAPGKARTAALFRKPSGDFEELINSGKRPAAVTSGFIMMKGGVPLVWQGQVVGAIGVSSASADKDVEIAKAGAAALQP